MGRLADVAVVEPDDAKPLRGQPLAERLRPGDELGGEAHDEQNERIAVASEAFIFDVDSVGSDLRHGGPPATLVRQSSRGAAAFNPIAYTPIPASARAPSSTASSGAAHLKPLS